MNKKLLLASTALGFLIAGTASAAGPTMTIGGYASTQYAYTSQDFDSTADDYDGPKPKPIYDDSGNTKILVPRGNVYSRHSHSATHTELYVNVKGKLDSGLTYGGHIELNEDVSPSDVQSDTNASKMYLFVESRYGRLQMGSFDDAGDTMRIDGSDVAVAAGGTGGEYWRYVNLYDRSGDASGGYYPIPGLTTASGLPGEVAVDPNIGARGRYYDAAKREYVPIETREVKYRDRATANKISYYSPRFGGAQIGISYTPDQAARGTAFNFNSRDKGFRGSQQIIPSISDTGYVRDNVYASFYDVWNGGISYENEFGNLGLKASLTGEFGNSRFTGTWIPDTIEYVTGTGTAADGTIDRSKALLSTFDDLEGYSIGVGLDYMGIDFAFAYGYMPEIGAMAYRNQKVEYFSAGFGYELGPFRASVTGFGSKVKEDGDVSNRDLVNVAIGLDYKLAPGFTPYVEVDIFDTDSNAQLIPDNSGAVFMIGTSLSF